MQNPHLNKNFIDYNIMIILHVNVTKIVIVNKLLAVSIL